MRLLVDESAYNDKNESLLHKGQIRRQLTEHGKTARSELPGCRRVFAAGRNTGKEKWFIVYEYWYIADEENNSLRGEGGPEMKHISREQVTCLEDLPDVGRAVAADLRLLGIERPQELLGHQPLELYRRLNRVTGTRHDPCMLDVFMAVIHFIEHGETLPWWKFTAQRKKLYSPDLLWEKE